MEADTRLIPGLTMASGAGDCSSPQDALQITDIGSFEFASILRLLDGYDISHLWFCGNNRLNNRLIHNVTKFEVVYTLKSTPQWPNIIQRFSSLRELRVSIETLDSRPSTRVLYGADLSTVPQSIRVIEFLIGNGLTLFSRPSPSCPLKVMELINIGNYFPNLEYLHCASAFEVSERTFQFSASSLPRSLLHLTTGVPLPIPALQIALLPPMLRTLKLRLTHEQGTSITFPSFLEHLDISNVSSVSLINNLPESLRSLRLGMASKSSLKVSGHRLHFPSSLERFEAFNWPNFPSWIAHRLPLSLKHFKFQGGGSLALDLLRHLPENLTSIELPALPLGFSASSKDLCKFASTLERVSPELNALLPRELAFPKLKSRILGCVDAINLHGGESTRKNSAVSERSIKKLAPEVEELYAVVCEPSTVSCFAFLKCLKSLRLDLISHDMDYSARLKWLGSVKSLKSLTLASTSRVGFLSTAEFRLDSLGLVDALPDDWKHALDFNAPALNGLKELTISFDDNELAHARPKAWDHFCAWLCARVDCCGAPWPPNLTKLNVDVIPFDDTPSNDDSLDLESDDDASVLAAALLSSCPDSAKSRRKTQRHRWLPIKGLSRLPKSLKSLTFMQLFPFDFSVLQSLPNELISLKLGAPACVLRDEDLELLPLSLDILSLPGSPNFDNPADVLQRVLPHIRYAAIKRRELQLEPAISNWRKEQLKLPGCKVWKPSNASLTVA